jgi:hypothetical protein
MNRTGKSGGGERSPTSEAGPLAAGNHATFSSDQSLTRFAKVHLANPKKYPSVIIDILLGKAYIRLNINFFGTCLAKLVITENSYLSGQIRPDNLLLDPRKDKDD